MKFSLPRTAVTALLIATSGIIAGYCSEFRLSESLLGVANPPFVVGEVVTDEQLSKLRCTESDNGLLVCPIRRYEDRMFGVMIDGSGSVNRVTAALVFWACEPSQCDQALEETVASYSETLGKPPEHLDGTPIWKDREASRRDLVVRRMGDGMISVTLLESDP